LREQDILDVLDPVPLSQIERATAVHEANTTDIDRLLADIDGATADVDIGVADGADHLRQRDVVGIELIQIDVNVVLLRGAPQVLTCTTPGTVSNRR
jgi:hypothetical protein